MFYILLSSKKPLVSYLRNTFGNEAIGNGVHYIPFTYFSFMDSLPPLLWSSISKLQMPFKLQSTDFTVKQNLLWMWYD